MRSSVSLRELTSTGIQNRSIADSVWRCRRSQSANVSLLVWFEIYEDPLTAITREKELKKWRRDWKVELIEANNAEWHDLYASIL